ncbi:MAG: phytoene desaturase [Calditrichaceae bacterium]|nr:phytoene desaturase family protein [Calditrichia bacterium]NUQ41262.1 phytoene desaturase [Calditrichaceae bacterium]
MKERVAIIGGGLGALSAAIRLQRRGFRVQLFERNSRAGGKMNEFTAGGYRFDTGPSLLTMPFVIDALFQFAGARREDYLEFIPLEPLCRYSWEDGAVLNASSDESQMAAEIAKLSREDAQHYPAFLDYARGIYELTAAIFLHSPIHEAKKLFTRENLRTLLRLRRIDPLRTLHQGVSRFFRDPRTVQLFDRFATYNGSDPFQAPATLNIIPYVEHGLGGYYIRGGMYRLAEALERLARDLGVEIHLNSPVEQIIHRGGRIRGVQVNGEFIEADYLVCNADVVSAHNRLIDGFPARRRKLNRLEPSLSGLVFLWGVAGKHSQLAHHNIVFSADYREEFRQIFRERRAPDDPTVYIAVTSKTDPAHAPAYGENWFVLLNMPYLEEGQDWRGEMERMREAVFRKLRRRGIDLRGQVETERVITPEEFYSRYGSNRGSIYGISSNRRSTAFRRPANRSRELKGLYFAGGSTHPGGGIPLTLLSGKIAAELIIEEAGRSGTGRIKQSAESIEQSAESREKDFTMPRSRVNRDEVEIT